MKNKQWIIRNLLDVISCVVRQPDILNAEVVVQKDPHRDGLVDSPGINTTGTLDQKHVLERFVSYYGKPAH